MKKRTLSLRRQIVLIVFLCWLLPVMMTLTVMGWYLSASVGPEAEKSPAQQLELMLRMCADRLDSAVEASRLASYDPTIDTAWTAYRRDGSYSALYRDTRAFLNRQYGSDSRFRFSVFWFAEDPENMTITTLSGITGAMYTQISRFWPEDFAAARKLAAGLDTSVGFLKRDDRVYLVRNLLDSDFETIGVLVLALNQSYYFEELSNLPWASAAEVRLGQAEPVPLLGECPENGSRGLLRATAQGSGYDLSARVVLDYDQLMEPFYFYGYLLAGMLLLLVPLLLFTFRFLQRKVTAPIAALMDGAAEIERGQLGHQLAYRPTAGSFNI